MFHIMHQLDPGIPSYRMVKNMCLPGLTPTIQVLLDIRCQVLLITSVDVHVAIKHNSISLLFYSTILQIVFHSIQTLLEPYSRNVWLILSLHLHLQDILSFQMN